MGAESYTRDEEMYGMEERYKVIISGRNFYREVELSPEMQELKVGTGMECGIRLHKEQFFEAIQLTFVKNGTSWEIVCGDNLYLSFGDVRKILTMRLCHGDSFEVRYQESDYMVFNIEFLIDFDSEKKRYEREIDISGHTTVRIGGRKDSQILIGGKYAARDSVVLYWQNDTLVLQIEQTVYGVYHDGRRVERQEKIKEGDFFSISDYSFYYRNRKLWTEIRSDMDIVGLSYQDYPVRRDYPMFHRNTRLKTVICEEEIEVLEAPEKPKPPKDNFFMRVFPSLGILIAAGAMAFLGGTMIIFSLISGMIAIVTAIMGIREGKKEYIESCQERDRAYKIYIAQKQVEIETVRQEEHKALEEMYVSLEVEKRRLETFSSDLFDRVPGDEDFLCVRIGNGAVEARRKIKYKKQERLEAQDELQMLPQKISELYKYIPNAPVICNLKAINAIGIIGLEAWRFELFKNMVVDIVSRQFFSDIRMFFVVNEEHKERVHWLRFLPNIYSRETQARTIANDDESKKLIFEYLYRELTLREEKKAWDSHIIIFLYDEYGFQSHPISKFLDKAKELGVTFLFFGDTKADIPTGCGEIIHLSDNNRGALINTSDQTDMQIFTYPHIGNRQARKVVDILAPVYAEEISLERSLTRNISLFEMLGILSVDDLDLEKRWKESKVSQSLAAPIGVTKSGTIWLDLHDKAHGPHGLVAGTTGSGKSEVLQTYILSMATLFHPYEVAFVIIDFKGGGMANQLEGLPHLLGSVTNIDGKEIDRSLRSIKAELQKRQKLFADAEVNHIDKYIQKYKNKEIDEPLPHLIIIVDEFAELKAEQPEFMKELISAARIGRSLGVHLILATQKPAGQVNEQIWSNSRFKLCLKVQSQEDSNEVIKSPLAAEIKEPGRAYLQVGNNEIFELFQSAYSGELAEPETNATKNFTIYKVPDAGRKIPVYIQKRQTNDGKGKTQLDAMIAYLTAYCRSINLRKLPDICLPPLPESVVFTLAQYRGNLENGCYVDLGIYDDPDLQEQGIYELDISRNNLFIVGSAQTGKTNLLQNVIRSLSARYTPDDVNIYILDFASMVLKRFGELNHVGGVVCAPDDEKLKNLFRMLHEEMDRRKEKILSAGVSSFAAYREAGKKDLPQIVLMIDNLTVLREMYFQDDDELLLFCREGLAAGISVVIANVQTAGIGYKYLSNFGIRLAMFCNDSSEYSAVFEHCSKRLENLPGRCLIEMEGRHLECQTYQAFAGEKEYERAEEISEYINVKNQENPKAYAKVIPEMPVVLNEQYMIRQFNDIKRFSVVMGLDYETIMPYVFNFSTGSLLAVAGKEDVRIDNWLKYCTHMLEALHPGMTKLYIVDDINKGLADLEKESNVHSYSVLTETAAEMVRDIEQELKNRYDAMASGQEEIYKNAPLLLLILNSYDSVAAICNDKESERAYKNIIGKYKNMKVSIIVSKIENTPVSYGAPEILKNIRDHRQMLFFDDITNLKIFDMPLSVQRKYRKPADKQDAFFIRDQECIKLKTALAE